jgi:hypothetical protein
LDAKKGSVHVQEIFCDNIQEICFRGLRLSFWPVEAMEPKILGDEELPLVTA